MREIAGRIVLGAFVALAAIAGAWLGGMLLAGVLGGVAAVGGVWLLERRSHAAVKALAALINQVNKDGDLSRAVVAGRGLSGDLPTALNQLIELVQGVVAKVISDSRRVAEVSDQLAARAERMSSSTDSQRDAANKMSAATEQMTANVYDVAEHASQTARIAQEARELSIAGGGVVANVSQEIERIAQWVEQSASVVASLGERSQAISGIVNVIREIADQTNLLALNAAIEAARAGEQGRGFAVVADEVRKLAERTSNATREITQMIAAIQNETASAINTIEEGSRQARSGAKLANSASDSLQAIDRGATSTMEKVDAIAVSIQGQSRDAEALYGSVQQILKMIEQNAKAAEETRGEAARLANLATNLGEIDKVFRLSAEGEAAIDVHVAMPAVAQEAAKAVGEAFEAAIAAGRITLEALFDDRYKPIPDTHPQKFTTAFDALTDEILPAIQEPILERHAAAFYAGAVDQRGYFPTHNKRFTQPLTGDPAKDMAGNRTKRIFDDPVGKRCGAHEMEYLVQTYRRDTGEVMHDVSAPIYVQGRHWGGFRIGFRA
ncbi:methyl-accepting chemotaxis protein [Niveibacterium sp. 24ML]|uniref:methyl-accepting chemotaxis protein n=1 Tax=Niveibacterium sp. 24ML TaxID=2985512 RepID=UPI002270127B|nr:methyl-accepting chemotaxis protein [Niveibacterium sp. 24ML]MCX9157217.1 methyl-accepting chemotaxis protein [Niveibacterium sp. 24ML]